MRCSNCNKADIWAPDVKVRGGVLRCVACDSAYIFNQKIVQGQGELPLTTSNDPQPMSAVMPAVAEKIEKKVRVPEVCEQCGFVEGPDATRADQVFERYGRALCRRCRRKGRDGTARRRGQRRR